MQSLTALVMVGLSGCEYYRPYVITVRSYAMARSARLLTLVKLYDLNGAYCHVLNADVSLGGTGLTSVDFCSSTARACQKM